MPGFNLVQAYQDVPYHVGYVCSCVGRVLVPGCKISAKRKIPTCIAPACRNCLNMVLFWIISPVATLMPGLEVGLPGVYKHL